MDWTENTAPLLMYATVAIETCFFAKLLVSNRCCIFAYLAVIVQQHVYMPHYDFITECNWTPSLVVKVLKQIILAFTEVFMNKY
jgi:hypothetical protein